MGVLILVFPIYPVLSIPYFADYFYSFYMYHHISSIWSATVLKLLSTIPKQGNQGNQGNQGVIPREPCTCSQTLLGICHWLQHRQFCVNLCKICFSPRERNISMISAFLGSYHGNKQNGHKKRGGLHTHLGCARQNIQKKRLSKRTTSTQAS